MSVRNGFANQVQDCEDELAVALAAQHEAVELRLALRAAHRRGGFFGAENVALALEAVPVLERALLAYCERLRAERGALRRGETP
jgi:hypothetical protein